VVNNTAGQSVYVRLRNMTDAVDIPESEVYMTGTTITIIKSALFDLDNYIGVKHMEIRWRVTGGTGTFYYGAAFLVLVLEVE